MFTKLYGGHGPVYLNVSLSYRAPISLMRESNSAPCSRETRNAAFLVARDAEAAFDLRVKDVGQRFDKLTFKYTGPWPPYNFVNIRLKLERA